MKPSWVKVKVKFGSAFAFTLALSYIASILFARVKFTCVHTLKLRDSGYKSYESSLTIKKSIGTKGHAQEVSNKSQCLVRKGER